MCASTNCRQKTQPIQRNSSMKNVCIVLGLLSEIEIDLARNPCKNVVHIDKTANNMNDPVDLNQGRRLRMLSNTSGVKNDKVALCKFEIDDVVWCNLKSHSKWPAKIAKIYGKNNQMVQLF